MFVFAFLPAVILFAALFFRFIKKGVDINKILKVIAVILFFSYVLQLEMNLAIDRTTALLGGPFSPSLTVWMVILRWLAGILTVVGVTSPFFPKNRSFQLLLMWIAPFILVLNIIYFPQNLIAYYGFSVDPLQHFQTYAMFVQYNALLLVVLLTHLSNYKMPFIFPAKKEWLTLFIVFLVLLPTMMPQHTLQIFFGPLGSSTDGFTVIHRLTIYFTFAAMAGIYIGLRNQSEDNRKLAIIVMSISSVFQYLYVQRLGLGALPLHLCNTAIFLMLIAFVFKVKSIFFFSYFVNVLGALCAIILPGVNSDAFHMSSVMFWYNHIYAFILPLLAVGLKIFPRPKFRMMMGAIGIFTIYFVAMMFVNAWFNNYETVDYFFLYSDFFVDKFPFAFPIKVHNVLLFTSGQLVFRFYWLYNLLIYIAFIVLMFIMWAVYDYGFQISDSLKALHLKLHQDRMDMLSLRKEMNGRPISEPLNLEGTKMIKIEHFTKRYGNAKQPAVNDFSLEVHDGEVFGFLGHNGAGKSTTIKSLVGIQSITSGRMEVAGYDVSKQPIEAKLRIGYVSDNHAVYERLTGREYINYIADLYLVPKQERDERIEKYVKMFNLTHAIDNEIKSYSHGMKQKIVVIASLIHEPKVWILDEPLTGLDPVSSFQIKEVMRDHANRGNIVFFSSHVIEVVEKICDRIAIISHGKLQGVYELKKIREQGMSLEELYMSQVAAMQTDGK